MGVAVVLIGGRSSYRGKNSYGCAWRSRRGCLLLCNKQTLIGSSCGAAWCR